MSMLLVTIFSLLTLNFAEAALETISIEKLNLEYAQGRGAGDLEKINLGFSFMPGPYPVEVERVEDTFVVKSPMVDLTWTDPGHLLLGIQKLTAKNLSLKVGEGKHAVDGEVLVLSPGGDKDYLLEKIHGHCQGASRVRVLTERVYEDCRDQMLLEVDQVNVPLDFMLVDILQNIPAIPEIDRPINDLYFTSTKGDFFLYFLARYYVKAGLRAWGHFHYEEDYKIIVIRVDKIKFGIFSVTQRVMRELKERIKGPRVKVDPPYIRIDLRSSYAEPAGHSGH